MPKPQQIERITQQLKEDILTGAFKPYNILPTIRALADQSGLAHVGFLLPLFIHPHASPFLFAHADGLHRQVIKAYRARMRVYREQRKSYDEAQHDALIHHGARGGGCSC